MLPHEFMSKNELTLNSKSEVTQYAVIIKKTFANVGQLCF